MWIVTVKLVNACRDETSIVPVIRFSTMSRGANPSLVPMPADLKAAFPSGKWLATLVAKPIAAANIRTTWNKRCSFSSGSEEGVQYDLMLFPLVSSNFRVANRKGSVSLRHNLGFKAMTIRPKSAECHFYKCTSLLFEWHFECHLRWDPESSSGPWIQPQIVSSSRCLSDDAFPLEMGSGLHDFLASEGP